MPSAATLTSLTTRLKNRLGDSSGKYYGTGSATVIDASEAIGSAFLEYQTQIKQHTQATVTLTAAGREITISSYAGLNGLLGVQEIWYPYTAATPEYPPNIIPWDLRLDQGVIYLDISDLPAVNDVLRIFFSKAHTLNGYAAAVATTYPVQDDEVLLTGAEGFAQLARAALLAETFGVSETAPDRLNALGTARLTEFRVMLQAAAIRARAQQGYDSRVQGAPLDRWDTRFYARRYI